MRDFLAAVSDAGRNRHEGIPGRAERVDVFRAPQARDPPDAARPDRLYADPEGRRATSFPASLQPPATVMMDAYEIVCRVDERHRSAWSLMTSGEARAPQLISRSSVGHRVVLAYSDRTRSAIAIAAAASIPRSAISGTPRPTKRRAGWRMQNPARTAAPHHRRRRRRATTAADADLFSDALERRRRRGRATPAAGIPAAAFGPAIRAWRLHDAGTSPRPHRPAPPGRSTPHPASFGMCHTWRPCRNSSSFPRTRWLVTSPRPPNCSPTACCGATARRRCSG